MHAITEHAYSLNNRRIFYGIIAMAGLLYSILLPHYRTGVFNDDAVYVIVANDLQNQKASQLLPTIAPDYPLPGLPILLAPFTNFIKPHWNHLEWVSVIVTLATLWMLGLWSRRWLTEVQSLWVVALFAFNPTVVKFSGILMPAPFYSFAVITGFYLMGRVMENPTTTRCLLLGVVLGWSSLVRPEGAILLVSIMVGLAFHRLRKRQLSLILLPVFLWGLFLVYWFHGRGLTGSDYGHDLAALHSYWLTQFSEAANFGMKFFRLLFCRTLLAFDMSSTDFRNAAVFLCFVLMSGGVHVLWKRSSAWRMELVSILLFCAAYIVVHVVWHIALARYCITLVPFIWILLLAGLLSWFPRLQKSAVALFLLLVPVLASYANSNVKAIIESVYFHDRRNAPPLRTLAWIRKNTPRDAIFISPFSPSIVLYSGRKSMPMFEAKNAEDFRYGLHVTHVNSIVDSPTRFVTPGVGKTENLNKEWSRMRRWVRAHPDWFEIAYLDREEVAAVFRVRHDPRFKKAFKLYNDAYLDMRKGDFISSSEKLEKCLKYFPQLGVAHNLKGILSFTFRDYEKAEASFQRAAALLPTDPLPLLNLASVHHKEGSLAQAIEVFNRGLAIIAANGNSKRRVTTAHNVIKSWQQNKELMVF